MEAKTAAVSSAKSRLWIRLSQLTAQDGAGKASFR